MSLWDHLTIVRLRDCVTRSRRARARARSLSLSLSPLFVRSIPFPIISYLCSTAVYDKTAGGERVERWQAAEKREKLD